jgi:hypothetical protein
LTFFGRAAAAMAAAHCVEETLMKTILAATLSVVIGSACDSSRAPAPGNERIAAAGAFTSLYAPSLAHWDVRGRAAGTDCSVLFVETAIVMDESIVEALHYGGGHYNTYRGGVDKFSRDRAFRGVAYKDSTGRLWTFGGVTHSEAESLAPCH